MFIFFMPAFRGQIYCNIRGQPQVWQGFHNRGGSTYFTYTISRCVLLFEKVVGLRMSSISDFRFEKGIRYGLQVYKIIIWKKNIVYVRFG